MYKLGDIIQYKNFHSSVLIKGEIKAVFKIIENSDNSLNNTFAYYVEHSPYEYCVLVLEQDIIK